LLDEALKEKMKVSTAIIFAIIFFSASAQVCNTIGSEIINCTDSEGRKQGYWKLTRKVIDLRWHSGLGSKEGCRYGESAHYLPVAEGNYKNDMKIGEWN